MTGTVLHKSTLFFLVVLISALFLGMIRQFLMPVFIAGLFAALASPLYRWLKNRMGGREIPASIATLLLIIFLILIPLGVLASVVVAQAIGVGQSVTPWIQEFIAEPSVLTGYLEKLPFYQQVLPFRDDIVHKLGELVAMAANLLVGGLQSVAKGAINAVFLGFIMLYAMFFFLINGDRFLCKILYYLPLEDHDEQRLLERFTSVARATIKGTLIIGVMQGAICGVGFAVAGIPSAVFWGTLMAVMSIIPAFGTAIVWGPALVILAVSGDWTGAIILLVICGGIAGNLDNLIRPRLVGKDTQMHDLFILFGTLGGIGMFGIIGIIIGPIIAALFVTIWEIYGEAFADYLPQVHMFGSKEFAQKDETELSPEMSACEQVAEETTTEEIDKPVV
jgi:predicted PurR-regulated permease PerM